MGALHAIHRWQPPSCSSSCDARQRPPSALGGPRRLYENAKHEPTVTHHNNGTSTDTCSRFVVPLQSSKVEDMTRELKQLLKKLATDDSIGGRRVHGQMKAESRTVQRLLAEQKAQSQKDSSAPPPGSSSVDKPHTTRKDASMRKPRQQRCRLCYDPNSSSSLQCQGNCPGEQP